MQKVPKWPCQRDDNEAAVKVEVCMQYAHTAWMSRVGSMEIERAEEDEKKQEH